MDVRGSKWLLTEGKVPATAVRNSSGANGHFTTALGHSVLGRAVVAACLVFLQRSEVSGGTRTFTRC